MNLQKLGAASEGANVTSRTRPLDVAGVDVSTSLEHLEPEIVAGGAFSIGMSEASFGSILHYNDWIIG